MGNAPAQQLRHGLFWPTDIKPTAIAHAMAHVRTADFAIKMAADPKAIAIQAGGNMGLWPLRMSTHFRQVHTFEPDPGSFHFLTLNTADVKNIIRWPLALGDARGACSIAHKSLGSHQVREGADVDVHTVDSMFPQHRVALIQLDVEGYELKVLKGARETIRRCQPVVQLELRGFGEKYGNSDDDVHRFMDDLNYCGVRQVGPDVVFWQF